MGVSKNEGYLRVPLTGYYRLFKGLEFPKIGGTLFWGPYKKDPTI